MYIYIYNIHIRIHVHIYIYIYAYMQIHASIKIHKTYNYLLSVWITIPLLIELGKTFATNMIWGVFFVLALTAETYVTF